MILDAARRVWPHLARRGIRRKAIAEAAAGFADDLS